MHPSTFLGPRSIGDLLDTAFRLYRAHFATFAGIAALLLIPMMILQLALLALFNTAALGRSLQSLLVVTVASGALTNAAAQVYFGPPPTILGAYRLPARRYVALIVAPLALALAAAIPLLVVFGCLFGLLASSGPSTASGGSAVAVIFTLILVVPMALLTLRFLLVDQAIVLESCGAIEGLRRSWRLIGGSFWRTFAMVVLLSILTYLISDVPALLVAFLLGLAGGFTDTISSQSIAIGLSQLGLVLALPLQVIAYTCLYYDLRVRTEGYDLEVLAQPAGAKPIAPLTGE